MGKSMMKRGMGGPQTKEVRAQLQKAGHDAEAAGLLQALYPTWCLSPGALLALCLLAQAISLRLPPPLPSTCALHRLKSFARKIR